MKLLWTTVLVLSCAAAWAQAFAPVQAPEQKIPTFRAEVKLVNVYVTVVDRNGAPVGGLTQDDFEIFEDGVAQKTAVFAKESELPLSIILALDTSLSTRKDLKLELDSAHGFVRSILRPVDALSLYQFAEETEELVPFTSDISRIDRGLKRAHIGSATAMYDAIFLASRALSRRQGRKVMVVITDGGDTISRVDYAEALRAAQIADTIVYSIIDVPIEASAGRNTGGEHALMQLATDTGGKFYYENSPEELNRAFRQVSEELRTQYLLGYYPVKRLADSDYRRIEVRLKADAGPRFAGLRPRHRAGYYTSKAE
ncbi:MAG: VWA domain-containing protein [Acidobacteriia bacterium]|nr:VWA domain-containing protein [Terriglobia bacterium]